MRVVRKVASVSRHNFLSEISTMSTGRFARQQRLLQASEFNNVFSKPCAKQGDANMLILSRKNSLKTARLGLAVAKKNLKLAVARNRFKRLTRESFRHHQSLLSNYDIVVMARSGAAQKSNRELLDIFEINWKALVKKCERSSQV